MTEGNPLFCPRAWAEGYIDFEGEENMGPAKDQMEEQEETRGRSQSSPSLSSPRLSYFAGPQDNMGRSLARSRADESTGLFNPTGPQRMAEIFSPDRKLGDEPTVRINRSPLQHDEPKSIVLSGSNISAQVSRCSGREIREPTYLKDFVTHVATHHPPCSPIPPKSSGMMYPVVTYLAQNNSPILDLSYMAAIDLDTEPQTYQEAISDPRWRAVMAKEIRALELT
ncbi:hypothetical protein CRG98_025871 [Punica granatum]|uniref:Uncharacterized protein n=1 Tax=Punica granatum TaxID=22663 RepID=A0A2I0JBW5_PUNGR|nr:hypothetical protein CRG98_025871 [Punica granatum]